MKKTEIERKFDEIVEFAEVEKFLDTPVKRFSSGMYVRLAFAVAAYLEPDILLVDEVLAVGDVLFQKKCLNKMENVAHEGRTVLFVSHNLGSVKSLCTRGIMLSDGKMIEDSDVGTTIEKYLSFLDGTAVSSGTVSWDINNAPGNEDFRLIKIYLENNDDIKKATFPVDESIKVSIHYRFLSPQPSFRIVLQLMTTTGEIVFTSTDQLKRVEECCLPGSYTSSCQIPKNLLNLGEYSIRIWAGVPGIRYLLDPTDFLKFSIVGNGGSFLHGDDQKWPGVVCPVLDWKVMRNSENGTNQEFVI